MHASITGLLLFAVVIATYVLELVPSEYGLVLVLGVVAVTAVPMWLTIVRHQSARERASDTVLSGPASGAASGGVSGGASGSEAQGRPEDLRFEVNHTFNISGRGVVAAGIVAAGTAQEGQLVALERDGKRLLEVLVMGVEAGNKVAGAMGAGTDSGLLLQGLTDADIAVGDIIIDAGART